MGAYFFGEEVMGFSCFEQGVPPLRGALLSFASPKESKQRKGDPGSAPLRGSLRYSVGRAACQNSPSAQTSQADYPRPTCVAQRLSRGPEKHPWTNRDLHFWAFFRVDRSSQKSDRLAPPRRLSGPLRGAEQRRNAGGNRRALFEGRSPELRSRPALRVAQGTRAAGTDPGVAFSLATFFWPHKRKYARQQGGNPCQPKPRSQKQRNQPC